MKKVLALLVLAALTASCGENEKTLIDENKRLNQEVLRLTRERDSLQNEAVFYRTEYMRLEFKYDELFRETNPVADSLARVMKSGKL